MLKSIEAASNASKMTLFCNVLEIAFHPAITCSMQEERAGVGVSGTNREEFIKGRDYFFEDTIDYSGETQSGSDADA